MTYHEFVARVGSFLGRTDLAGVSPRMTLMDDLGLDSLDVVRIAILLEVAGVPDWDLESAATATLDEIYDVYKRGREGTVTLDSLLGL